MSSEDRSACEFLWAIENPFLPWQSSEANFYEGNSSYPTVCRAVFEPGLREIGLRTFVFSLQCYPSFFDWRPTRATRFEIRMALNNNSILRVEETNYFFNASNRYMYSRELQSNLFTPEVTPLLEIHVLISFEIRSSEWADGIQKQLRFEREAGPIIDLNRKLLSESLGRLLNDATYSNMNLVSAADDAATFSVHTYMILQRWKNFFQNHRFHPENQRTVQLDISAPVLRNILIYLYSGEIDTAWSNDRNAAYFAELFQVMHRYKLYHLYKCFIKNDMEQVRIDNKLSFRKIIKFRLNTCDDLPIDYVSYTVPVYLSPQNRLILQFAISNRYGAGPWLSYSLQSNAQIRFHVHVTLKFECCYVNIDGDASRTVHESEYTIDPNGNVRSGPLFFLGCPETFPELNPLQYGVIPFFKVFLHVTDGIAITRIHNLYDTPLGVQERYSILSDDMFELWVWGMITPEKDLTITGPINRPIVIHKGIFAIRMPDWRLALENYSHLNELPDTVTCDMDDRAMYYFLEYLYTGKSDPEIPSYMEEEIEEFAGIGGCEFYTQHRL